MASYAGYKKLTHRDQARDEFQSERTKSKAVAPDIRRPFSTNSKVKSLESLESTVSFSIAMSDVLHTPSLSFRFMFCLTYIW